MIKFQVGRTNLREPYQVKPDDYALMGGGGSLRPSHQLWSCRDGQFT